MTSFFVYGHAQKQIFIMHEAESSITGIDDNVKAVKSMYPAQSKVAIVGCGKYHSYSD
jgi:hypothetical protein